jgi:hypothetical protein
LDHLIGVKAGDEERVDRIVGEELGVRRLRNKEAGA